jgi:hypothetical protein
MVDLTAQLCMRFAFFKFTLAPNYAQEVNAIIKETELAESKNGLLNRTCKQTLTMAKYEAMLIGMILQISTNLMEWTT